MPRFPSLSRILVFSALIVLCHSAQAQITINPADILNKILHRNNPTVKPNVPSNQIVPPANDNFANREQLTGTDIRVTADNRGATTEPGEPVHFPSERNANTVWWTWTAPATGKLAFDTLDNVCRTQNTGIAVYIGDSLDTLIPVARSYGETNNYRLGLPVEGGRTYQIAFSNPQAGIGFIGFNLHFTKTALPPPVLGRDNFADRPTLLGIEAMAVANNEQTTLETDEPTHIPGRENFHTVWWSWKAPVTGKVTIDTLKLGIVPTALIFYTGASLDSLVPVIRTNGISEGDKMVFPVAGGQTYQIVSNGGSGQIGFNLHFVKTLLPPPVSGRDNFADRAVLKGSEAVAVANNEQASVETDEPDHTPGQKNANTMWWTWTAPAAGRVAIDTLGGIAGTPSLSLTVYTGSDLSSLEPVTRGNSDAKDFTLGFPVKPGVAYQIVANGYGGCVGQIGFNLHFHPLHPKPVVKQ